MIFQNKIFKDIRFWIVFFFILRLYGITNPPLEISHNWRQSLTSMTARNFLETDNNILYPRIDMAGEKTGIIGSEFPFFNYLIYLVSLFAGYQHWYGRLINLIISSFGIYFFYKLVKEYFKKEIAFYAALMLLTSIWFSFSRKIMPDTLSVSFCITGLYFSFMFLKERKIIQLILFFLFSTLGVLCKLPAISLLSILVIPMMDRGITVKAKLFLSFASALLFAIISVWYFYWVPYLVTTYGYQLYFPKTIPEGFNEFIPHWKEALEKFYFSSLNSYVALLAFIAGIIFMIVRKERKLTAVFLIFSSVFLIFMLKTGAVFPLHNYYVIPYTPLMALIAAYGIQEIKKPIFRTAVIALIMIEGIANQQHDFRIKGSEKYKLTLEKIADEVSSRSDKIVINGGGSPQQLYFTHRKGWTIDNEKLNDINFLNEIKDKGCKYIFVNKSDFKNKLNFTSVFENDFFTVYKL